MGKNILKIRANLSEKKLTKISQFFNLFAGKVPHENAPNPSLSGRQLIQLKNKGQNFE